MTGDPAAVDGVLAPEFQILRSDGTGHDKTSYLKALPKHNVRSTFSDIVATGNADIMVIRYRIETDQTVEGKAVKGVSPAPVGVPAGRRPLAAERTRQFRAAGVSCRPVVLAQGNEPQRSKRYSAVASSYSADISSHFSSLRASWPERSERSLASRVAPTGSFS